MPTHACYARRRKTMPTHSASCTVGRGPGPLGSRPLPHTCLLCTHCRYNSFDHKRCTPPPADRARLGPFSPLTTGNSSMSYRCRPRLVGITDSGVVPASLKGLPGHSGSGTESGREGSSVKTKPGGRSGQPPAGPQRVREVPRGSGGRGARSGRGRSGNGNGYPGRVGEGLVENHHPKRGRAS